eukprot:2289025-Amphidinium_carterae.1
MSEGKRRQRRAVRPRQSESPRPKPQQRCQKQRKSLPKMMTSRTTTLTVMMTKSKTKRMTSAQGMSDPFLWCAELPSLRLQENLIWCSYCIRRTDKRRAECCM